jgi:hypothetical protein
MSLQGPAFFEQREAGLFILERLRKKEGRRGRDKVLGIQKGTERGVQDGGRTWHHFLHP